MKQYKILFVVHRYHPFPGGSEYYVEQMATELVKRGHGVDVLTGEGRGESHGVEERLGIVAVRHDFECLTQPWDLIIVHGGDVDIQNIVHINARVIKSPVCYMLIKPSESDVCMHGLKYHNIIAYSTQTDLDFIHKHGVQDKARRIRHGVDVEKTMGHPWFDRRVSYGDYYMSAGGFWSNKAMTPLAEAWEKSDIENKLVLFGYDQFHLAPPETSKVKIITGADKQTVMDSLVTSKGYIQNSYDEGFGLVLLEAMFNKIPWFARDIAGAHDMSKYGSTYANEEFLIELIKFQDEENTKLVTEQAYKYAMANRTIQHTVNDIIDILAELK
jgi:glycosyltransferase involved in cell wall biosynthesis